MFFGTAGVARDVSSLAAPWYRRQRVLVATGFAASSLLAWAACSGRWVFHHDEWPNTVVAVAGSAAPEFVYQIAFALGQVLLCVVWLASVGRLRRPLVALVAWALPLLLVPPVASNDAVSYADLGYQVLQGADPYTAGQATLGGPFAAYVDGLWTGSGVAYPPLSLLINAGVVAVTGADPYWSVVAMRVPALVGVALMAWALVGIARHRGQEPSMVLWWGVLNPIVIVHFVGGAHNDALMAGVVLVAIRLAVTRGEWGVRWLVSPTLVGVAMGLKPQAGLAVVAVAGVAVLDQLRRARLFPRLWALGWRSAVAAAVAVGTLAALTAASGLGWGWLSWWSSNGAAGTLAPFRLFADAWIGLGGDDVAVRSLVGTLSTASIVVALAVALVRFSDRPVHAVGWGSLAISVLGQALQPWYLPWSLAVLGIDIMTKRQRLVIVGLMIAVMIGVCGITVLFYNVR